MDRSDSGERVVDLHRGSQRNFGSVSEHDLFFRSVCPRERSHSAGLSGLEVDIKDRSIWLRKFALAFGEPVYEATLIGVRPLDSRH